jgi:hypothetical protein
MCQCWRQTIATPRIDSKQKYRASKHQLTWNLRSSGMLCGVDWLLVADVSEGKKPTGLIFKDSAVHEWDGTDVPKRRRLSVYAALTSQKITDLLYVAKAAWNHAISIKMLPALSGDCCAILNTWSSTTEGILTLELNERNHHEMLAPIITKTAVYCCTFQNNSTLTFYRRNVICFI